MCTAASVATIVVISGVTAEENQFTILSFPPLMCDEKESGFYNSILPGAATYFMAITMLATIGWVIHKVYLECCVHHVIVNGNGLIVICVKKTLSLQLCLLPVAKSARCRSKARHLFRLLLHFRLSYTLSTSSYGSMERVIHQCYQQPLSVRSSRPCTGEVRSRNTGAILVSTQRAQLRLSYHGSICTHGQSRVCYQTQEFGCPCQNAKGSEILDQVVPVALLTVSTPCQRLQLYAFLILYIFRRCKPLFANIFSRALKIFFIIATDGGSVI